MKFMFAKSLALIAAMTSWSACAQQPSGDFHSLIAGKLVRSDGTEASADALKDKTVLVYFSAHWCPPCRRFTPELVKAYNQWKTDDKPVELVFVSSDKDEAAMTGYMTETKMEWLAVPFADRDRKNALARNWSVRGIPMLVVVSPEGKTLSTDGVSVVYAKRAAALEDWIKP